MTRADIDRGGHSDRTIRKLLDRGAILRTRHGIYRLAGQPPAGEFAFVEACRITPRGVVSLVSALSHYGLTTQIPIAVDLAVPPGSNNEAPADLPIRYVKMAQRLLNRDVLRVAASTGGFFRIFSPERSVCDAFRYRKLVGEDIAYEALGALLHTAYDRKKFTDAARATKTEAFVLPPLRTLDANS